MDTLEILGKQYRPRLVDQEIDRLLKITGGLVLEGPRGCGKTMTGVHAANSAVFMDNEASIALTEIDSDYPLQGAKPHLIDEWQVRPQLWNQVRRSIDKTEGFGHFILTGSATPADDVTRHTGAARMLRLRMRTMTWQEKGFGDGSVSVQSLFNGETVRTNAAHFNLQDNLTALLTSGFPGQISLTPEDAQSALRGYLRETARADVGRVVITRQSPALIMGLLTSLARNTAGDVSLRTLKLDLQRFNPTLSEATVSSLVDALERLFVLERVMAWPVTLRSKARLRKSPKLHLADPALAAIALGAGAHRLLRDLETLGLLFESAVIHDLAVLMSMVDGEVFHYRDSNGKEIDAIVVLPDGRWGAIEVKLGSEAAIQAAQRLPVILEDIKTEEPASFMAVITAVGPYFTTSNGVVSFPLLSLAP